MYLTKWHNEYGEEKWMNHLVTWEFAEIQNQQSTVGENQILHTMAWKLLKESLAVYSEKAQIPIQEKIEIIRDQWNKPHLLDYPDIHFNLTHCQGMVACIIGHKTVGIDCERIRPFHKGVMKKVCNSREQQLISQSKCPEETFFKLWTLKESYIKSIGKGLQFPMNKICFSLDEKGKIHSNTEGFYFSQIVIEGRFCLAICEEK